MILIIYSHYHASYIINIQIVIYYKKERKEKKEKETKEADPCVGVVRCSPVQIRVQKEYLG